MTLALLYYVRPAWMYLSDVCGSKVVAEKSTVRFENKCKCPPFKNILLSSVPLSEEILR